MGGIASSNWTVRLIPQVNMENINMVIGCSSLAISHNDGAAVENRLHHPLIHHTLIQHLFWFSDFLNYRNLSIESIVCW